MGTRVRDIYAEGAQNAQRIRAHVDNAYVAELAIAVTGGLGGSIGVAPRVFLKKLVGDVLDRVDDFEDFDPRRDYPLTISDTELTAEEREARAARTADDVPLDLL